MPKVVPVIMCGGSGTRLWPLSRADLPKQFIPITGEKSSFQSIASLLSKHQQFETPIVITNLDYRFLVAEQLDQVGIKAHIILEPVRRDSAPAVAVAAELGILQGPDTIVVVFAADHAIANPEQFYIVLQEAIVAASLRYIVTLGIEPEHPATGYGYIKRGASVPDAGSVSLVEQFIEKPDIENAKKFLHDGYLWNSGNFIFPAGLMQAELQTYEPDIAQAAADAVSHSKRDLQFVVLDDEAFRKAPQKSIDYAVMERTEFAAVVPANIGWSDIGTWSSVSELVGTDEHRNAIIGDGLAIDCENVLIHSPDTLTTALGLKDIVIVTTTDSILVVDRAQAGNVKEVVAQLNTIGRREAKEHRFVMRPWGHYQSIGEGERHQVKRIVVKPGGRLSLQKHFHRAEHWIVVKGTAEVTVDDIVKSIHENESIYVPIGSTHRLANLGKIDLELIEVQTGSYLGEDDIVRIEDVYNR